MNGPLENPKSEYALDVSLHGGIESVPNTIPYGFCHCGCGRKTNIARTTVPKLLQIKGEPFRYIFNHHKPNKRPLEARFWEKVDVKGTTECWEWKGKTAHGYGYISSGIPFGHTTLRVHRVSYGLHYGTIPEGMDVLHKCDNPP